MRPNFMRVAVLAVLAFGSATCAPLRASAAATDAPECSFSTLGVRVVVNPPRDRAVVLFANRGSTDAYVLLTRNEHHGNIVGRQHDIAPGDTFAFGPSSVQTVASGTFLRGHLYLSKQSFSRGIAGVEITGRVNACLNGFGFSTPSGGYSGGVVSFFSGGFLPAETVDLYSPDHVVLASAVANSTGTIAIRDVPTPALPFGTHTFEAVGETSGTVVEFRYHVRPLLVLIPSSGPVGTRVTASLTGFGADATTVTVRRVTTVIHRAPVIATAHTDSTGSATAEFTVDDLFAPQQLVCAVQPQINNGSCQYFTLTS